MGIGNDRGTVRNQYRREDGLTTRMSIWQPPEDGITAQDIAVDELRAAAPSSILEIGCGTGLLAARIAEQLPGIDLLATDQSERMVALTAGRGVVAQLADADALPFDDQQFDAVLAAWMLYHVPDLDRTLSEVRRVLRGGGTFVAITNGHSDIWLRSTIDWQPICRITKVSAATVERPPSSPPAEVDRTLTTIEPASYGSATTRPGRHPKE